MTDVILFLLLMGVGLGVLLKKALANPDAAERLGTGLWNVLRK